MYSLDYYNSFYFSPCGVPVTAILHDFLTVWTEMSSPAKVSDEPEKWSSNYFYTSYDGPSGQLVPQEVWGLEGWMPY